MAVLVFFTFQMVKLLVSKHWIGELLKLLYLSGDNGDVNTISNNFWIPTR